MVNVFVGEVTKMSTKNLSNLNTTAKPKHSSTVPLESELCLEALARASSLGGNSPAIPLSLESKLVFL